MQVDFGESLDNALARRVIHVTDAKNHEVVGKADLKSNERTWEFTPEERWSAGNYKVQAQDILEDLAGNNIGKPFEVDLFERVEKSPVKLEAIPFRVGGQ